MLYSTSHIIHCQWHHNFRKHKSCYWPFKIEWTKWVWMHPHYSFSHLNMMTLKKGVVEYHPFLLFFFFPSKVDMDVGMFGGWNIGKKAIRKYISFWTLPINQSLTPEHYWHSNMTSWSIGYKSISWNVFFLNIWQILILLIRLWKVEMSTNILSNNTTFLQPLLLQSKPDEKGKLLKRMADLDSSFLRKKIKPDKNRFHHFMQCRQAEYHASYGSTLKASARSLA